MDRELELALPDRIADAENLWRFFCRRDEMNAEVHRPEDIEATNVRYSPITIAAERVVEYLHRIDGKADFAHSDVHTGGAPIRVGWVNTRTVTSRIEAGWMSGEVDLSQPVEVEIETSVESEP